MAPHLLSPHRRDAKLSVLAWDDGSDAWRTSSLHYFEGDRLLRGGRHVFAPRPQGSD